MLLDCHSKLNEYFAVPVPVKLMKKKKGQYKEEEKEEKKGEGEDEKIDCLKEDVSFIGSYDLPLPDNVTFEVRVALKTS